MRRSGLEDERDIGVEARTSTPYTGDGEAGGGLFSRDVECWLAEGPGVV